MIYHDYISFKSLLPNSKNMACGLDIGTTAVKVMLLRKKNAQIQVAGYACEPLPTGAVIAKNIIQPEPVVVAIKAAMAQLPVAMNKVCVAVPSAASVTRIIKMQAAFSDKEIGSEIELEAQRYIPYPLAEVNLDYTVLGPVEDNPALVNVLLAVAKTEYINNILGVLTAAGLVASIIDIDAFALYCVFSLAARQLPASARNQVIAILDTGATFTTLNVFAKNKIVYTREQTMLSIEDYGPVDHIFLTGGSNESAINPCAEFTLAAGLDPLAFKQALPRLMLCCGLALRGIAAI